MSRHNDAIRLRHMLDAAHKALQFARGRTRVDLDRDELLALAPVRLIEVIGKAARHVSQDVRQRYPDIPWKEIAGTRDRLIHGYFDVDLDVVWAIISSDLPALAPAWSRFSATFLSMIEAPIHRERPSDPSIEMHGHGLLSPSYLGVHQS